MYASYVSMWENRINLSGMQETPFILTSNKRLDRPLGDGLFCMFFVELFFISKLTFLEN